MSSSRTRLKNLFSAPTKFLPGKITEADLINAEAEIGRDVFGPAPAGRNRQFFCHKKNVWLWHESWTELGEAKTQTVRYEVRPSGVFKRDLSQSSYIQIKGAELENFRLATHQYLKLVKEKLY